MFDRSIFPRDTFPENVFPEDVFSNDVFSSTITDTEKIAITNILEETSNESDISRRI